MTPEHAGPVTRLAGALLVVARAALAPAAARRPRTPRAVGVRSRRWLARGVAVLVAPVASVILVLANVWTTLVLELAALRPLGFALSFHGVPYLAGAVVLGRLLAALAGRRQTRGS